VDAEEAFGLDVVRFELAISDRPRRRHSLLVLQHAEVLLPEARQTGAVHLRVAAHVVLDPWLERLAAGVVVPRLRVLVALFDEDR
jgi:hypothetical protein